jgi:hypothetical protein
LGIGFIVDSNEVSQYYDVYTSYKKKERSSYHTSIRARDLSRLGIGATVDPNKVSRDKLVQEGWE